MIVQARLRRIAYCLLPLVLGTCAALALLLQFGGRARLVYAGTLTFPGCAATIQGCIDIANPGDTIIISAGNYTESLTLSKAVSMTGALSSTTILHALPSTRVLTVTGAAVDSSVVISGLTFTGGHVTGPFNCLESCGGGVLLTSNAQPSLINLRLISNTASWLGGGLETDGAVVLSGIQFIDNFADQGGGMFGAVTLTGAQFLSNTAASDGGGMAGGGSLTDVLFAGNAVTGTFGEGGGMSAGNAAFTRVRFAANSAHDGGGMEAQNSSIAMTDTQFVGNTATSSGGGFEAAGDNNSLTLTGVTFIGNRALIDFGGGLEVGGELTATATQFVSNTAYNQGGGLFLGAHSSAQLTDVQFVGNATTGISGGVGAGGGIEARSDTTMTLAGGLFLSNTSTDIGGGLVAETVSISGTRFEGNSAGNSGGGLFAYSAAQVTNAIFIRNRTAALGGGLTAVEAGVTGTQFISNTADEFGGGIALVGGGRLVNSLLTGNRANYLGDGLYADLSAGSASIVHTTFANQSPAPGAAVYVSSGTVGITDTIFSSYTVGIEQAGGGVFQDYNLFFGNSANISGTVVDGAHSRLGDPAFFNPAGDDYHLGTGSVAVDAGANVGVSTDIDGDPRPQGLGFDIGFDESSFTALANVGVTKSASASVRQPGQTLSYTLVYSNLGPYEAGGVRLTDHVPAYLTGLTYTSSGAALTSVGSSPYTWQVANLAPGAGGVVTVTGVVSGGQVGTVFTNTATITTAYADTNPINNTSAVSVTLTAAKLYLPLVRRP